MKKKRKHRLSAPRSRGQGEWGQGNVSKMKEEEVEENGRVKRGLRREGQRHYPHSYPSREAESLV